MKRKDELTMDSSADMFERAQRVIPGGVNSPVRACVSVGGKPVFFRDGLGSRLVDVDGREYVDVMGSWGPLILGHAHPDVVSAVCDAARGGTSIGACTAAEVELAELITSRFSSVEKVRLVSSGTEAAMSALRLARGVTGRDEVVKFAGCYHGHADSFLIQAGSGALTLGVPSSPGVPADLAKLTRLARFNDLDNVRKIFEEAGASIAALIVEPVAGNMGVVPPAEGFLAGLREICDEHAALLIFDEVITGFRVSAGGAQERYEVVPDLTVMGKVVGGGLPVGGFGGPAKLMDQVAPEGPVYQAGTLSGNPLATAAGLATLRALGGEGIYEALERSGAALAAGLEAAIASAGVTARVQRVGSMMTLFFNESPVASLDCLDGVRTDLYARFYQG
ncbi:MAG: glutamate-1-semialdehyde 2,1-aminomutase, partial [Planctomycetota bacterium]|nr:glutamate-1-semialdehyde 2,1-aminomutase [Planctomycetota bacterium]